MRKKIVAGNWKMNCTLDDAIKLTSEIVAMYKDEIHSDVHVVLSPPFPFLNSVNKLTESTAIKIAAQNCQIILSTQSAYLLNFFEVKDIIVVSSKNDTTVFEHLDEKKLAIWLNDYTIAEIWDKNLIGGRP